jgi:2-oxoglutarate dehydrogenase E2 component (dihydrolipoamide succinyltransferase)
MSIEIKVPELPESVADAVVASWYKQVGEKINADEVLVDLETDKVILEVPTLKQGVVQEILFSVGDTVTAGQLLAIIDESAINESAAEEPTVDESSADSSENDETVSNSAGAEQEAPRTVAAKKTNGADAGAKVAAMSPSVRKLATENDIDVTQIKGTGKNGRILRQDVEGYLSVIKAEEDARAKTERMTKASSETVPVRGDRLSSERLERRVPMTRLRARIAERLLQSQQQSAILTTFNEVNMKPVMELRSRYKVEFEKKHSVRLGFMSLFVQACVEALKRFPEINASIDGNDIIYHGYYDIGVAVSGPNGLVVPILRDADMMSIADVERTIVDYADKAMNNKLSIEDITGGTFTLSNGGVFGSMLSTPIINPPQSAILGMHNITERAMVIDGEVKVLPMMYLALSYDHRLIDGKSAVQFLVTVKQLLEDPSRLLLGV